MNHEWQKPFKCSICYASSARSGNSKTHVATVHKGIKLFKCSDFNCSICSKVETWKDMLQPFMEGKSHSIVPFVMLVLLKVEAWKHKFRKYMRGISHQVWHLQCYSKPKLQSVLENDILKLKKKINTEFWRVMEH